MSDRLSKSLQENILCLLVFDEENGPLIRNSVDLGLYEGLYGEVAERAYDYYDEFKEVPKEHISDLFDDLLESDNRKSNQVAGFLTSLYESKDTINSEYVISELTGFIRQQQLKTAIMEAAGILQEGGDDYLNHAERILGEASKNMLKLFDPGVILQDTIDLVCTEDPLEEVFFTGIPELDRLKIGPTRKQLDVFIGLAKRGKTWWLVNNGKQALVQNKKVLHITLEVSEKVMAQRYWQTLFAIAKRDGKVLQAKYEFEDGKFSDIDFEYMRPPLNFEDPRISRKLHDKVRNFGNKFTNLIIKAFPTGQLTIHELIAYLDSLELRYNFIPDLILVDYPDLMKIDMRNPRFGLGQIFKDLRGIAVERNMAISTVTQSNREGLSDEVQTVTERHVAEDFSKIATADCVITYSQTASESALKLARLYVANSRTEEDKFQISIIQNYHIGQFCLKSFRLWNTKPYFEKLDAAVGDLKTEAAS